MEVRNAIKLVEQFNVLYNEGIVTHMYACMLLVIFCYRAIVPFLLCTLYILLVMFL